ncbi:MAG TPA: DUF3048 domain-containing protein [Streptomyces sp.]|nr:DUF3048 domain-containing protein [Streptomyces sp.]
MADGRNTNGDDRRERAPGGRFTGRTARAVVLLVLAGLAALAVVVASCQGGDGDRGAGGPGRSPSPGQSTPGSPGTGGPVLAVKLDNAPVARPHTGLERADVVYVEQVEAGLTRLLAVYTPDHLPPTVGPVRSARESDIELLRQYGEPVLAYSGAQSRLMPLLRAAPVHLLSPADAPGAFSRAPERPAPHNLYLDPRAALRAAPDAKSELAGNGFRYGPAPEGGRADAEESVRFPGSRTTFTWSAAENRWLVSLDGAPARTTGGDRLGPLTAVIQYVTVRPSRFQDRGGSVSPYTETTGSGRALVLRDGRAYEARWSRPGPEDGTVFTARGGERMTFARGQVWVVLAPR